MGGDLPMLSSSDALDIGSSNMGLFWGTTFYVLGAGVVSIGCAALSYCNICCGLVATPLGGLIGIQPASSHDLEVPWERGLRLYRGLFLPLAF